MLLLFLQPHFVVCHKGIHARIAMNTICIYMALSWNRGSTKLGILVFIRNNYSNYFSQFLIEIFSGTVQIYRKLYVLFPFGIFCLQSEILGLQCLLLAQSLEQFWKLRDSIAEKVPWLHYFQVRNGSQLSIKITSLK